MGKILKPAGGKRSAVMSYTKHYYIGSERISAKTGTCVNIGYYPQGYLATKMPNLDANLVRTSSDDKVDKAENNINYVHEKLSLNPPALNSTDDYVEESSNFNHLRNLDYFYFHPDHLGSSSYISNAAGTVSQHMEYLPFGELLVDEQRILIILRSSTTVKSLMKKREIIFMEQDITTQNCLSSYL